MQGADGSGAAFDSCPVAPGRPLVVAAPGEASCCLSPRSCHAVPQESSAPYVCPQSAPHDLSHPKGSSSQPPSASVLPSTRLLVDWLPESTSPVLLPLTISSSESRPPSSSCPEGPSSSSESPSQSDTTATGRDALALCDAPAKPAPVAARATSDTAASPSPSPPAPCSPPRRVLFAPRVPFPASPVASA